MFPRLEVYHQPGATALHVKLYQYQDGCHVRAHDHPLFRSQHETLYFTTGRSCFAFQYQSQFDRCSEQIYDEAPLLATP